MTNALGTFSKIYHMLGHKTKFNKVKRIGITWSMFFDKIQWNYKSITKGNLRISDICGNLKNTSLNNQWKELRRNHKENYTIFEMKENEDMTYQNLWNIAVLVYCCCSNKLI